MNDLLNKKCPMCAEEILINALKCKHCGEMVDRNIKFKEEAIVVAVKPAFHRGVAAILSVFIPGLGQMYAGRVGTGLAWLMFTFFGYVLFIIPGLALHVACILEATNVSKVKA